MAGYHTLGVDRLFINGEFVPSVSHKKFDVINPAAEEIAASIYEAGAEDVDLAVEAAKAAFPEWSALSADVRCDYLSKLADEIDQYEGQITYMEAITMVMLGTAKRYLNFFAHKAINVTGETSLNTPEYLNFSILGPALAAGNTMVLKSSEKSPLSAIFFASLCQKVGLPKGVPNILNGFGRPCGEAFSRHMDIRRVSFTGSVATGRVLQKAANESNLKNIGLELGGKSPLLFFDDASLEKAVRSATFSILYNSGQVCMASSRIYVQEEIAPKFVAALKEEIFGPVLVVNTCWKIRESPLSSGFRLLV
ncbi:Aldehyde/histidinol dehydrogenase [Fusarium redolens]|uniref:aldehyde dehydrogenase (NAD(+)) n=1 Tax=Fusarium redolens TaxID=48865 RepID=A0A9P9JVE1_FUSRE|nr:Aldehyde/histidinol dehydrogenase [Fusarium redolens]KAH7233805.1 Aldehyde/histidinol dehydrogenase [Fusarium redolens]